MYLIKLPIVSITASYLWVVRDMYLFKLKLAIVSVQPLTCGGEHMYLLKLKIVSVQPLTCGWQGTFIC